MPFTRTLRPAPPLHPLDIHPLARIHPDGRLELLGAAFPPLGPVRLAVWRPGCEPAFVIVGGRIARGWIFDGPARDGFVVCWVSAGDPAQPL